MLIQRCVQISARNGAYARTGIHINRTAGHDEASIRSHAELDQHTFCLCSLEEQFAAGQILEEDIYCISLTGLLVHSPIRCQYSTELPLFCISSVKVYFYVSLFHSVFVAILVFVAISFTPNCYAAFRLFDFKSIKPIFESIMCQCLHELI